MDIFCQLILCCYWIEKIHSRWNRSIYNVGNISIIYCSINQASFFVWGKLFEQSLSVQRVTFWEVRLDQKAYYGQSVDSLEPCSIQFFCTGITSSSWYFERQTFSPLTRGQVANYCNMDEVKAFQTRPK